MNIVDKLTKMHNDNSNIVFLSLVAVTNDKNNSRYRPDTIYKSLTPYNLHSEYKSNQYRELYRSLR